jgi:hypothetical protein
MIECLKGEFLLHIFMHCLNKWGVRKLDRRRGDIFRGTGRGLGLL